MFVNAVVKIQRRDDLAVKAVTDVAGEPEVLWRLQQECVVGHFLKARMAQGQTVLGSEGTPEAASSQNDNESKWDRVNRIFPY